MAARVPAAQELERFRAAQRLAYRCARGVAGEIEPGVTETEVSALLGASARAAGADGWFHAPLVFFGERTAFRGMRSRMAARPSDARLAPNMPVMFDLAPVFDGIPADVSLSFAPGGHPLLERAERDLAGVRELVPRLVGEGRSVRELVRALIAAGESAGWKSVQHGYLFGAFGHRVFPVPRNGLSRHLFLGLGLPTAAALFGRALGNRVPLVRSEWPFWNDAPASERPPGLGLWSVEPHFAREGVGVKWEELLVVDTEGAHWLEADPLHTHP